MALRRVLLLALACVFPVASAWGAEAPAAGKVSYSKQIRPIFQANCQGCHQPAKAGGDYVMTAFDRMLKGGSTGMAAIVPGKPDESELLEQITPVEGKAEMPKGKAPLAEAQIKLIRQWIAEGATDDSPAKTAQYDMEHPPTYVRPPVVTALDFSPNGELLAIGGFHEVLLMKGDGSALVARLVGLSERIESVRFSPDGKQLAVTGGLPARVGEVQVWDVDARKLVLSVPMTADTIYGGNWSPDGKLISFGCADNSVRAIDAKTGEQVLFQGAHDDWVLDTVFSKDGANLVSVGRDGTVKLTEVATQRFVDNITSITPGALKGGIATVARHPQRDEIVIGGSDGVAKVYRIFRQTGRVIGDDSNLIRIMPGMPGRIFSVAVSADGKRLAAGSSLDGAGEVQVYSYEFDTSLPDNIKGIMSKVSTTRSADERALLEKYHTDGVRVVSKTPVSRAGVFALAFRPDGQVLAASGADGVVRFINPENGEVTREFSPAPIGGAAPMSMPTLTDAARTREEPVETETLPEGAKLVGLSVQPPTANLNGRFDYTQLQVVGQLDNGETLDVTRMVQGQFSAPVAELSPTGLLRPKTDGQANLALTAGGQTANVAVNVVNTAADVKVDYVHDVTPLLSKLGCNQGTCHGAAKGKAGFKLSLRGYDPIFDIRALTDDHGSRRVNLASPGDSLMLVKPTGEAPHVGGVLMQPGDVYYDVLRNWIANGAKLDLASPKVVSIDLLPKNPVVQRIGSKQQMRVIATYADGKTRDVTREAFVDTGNGEVATASKIGLMTAVRRGEAPILARYEGSYAATTLTVMGNRSGFAWQQPPANNRIDELTAAKWQQMKILPSELCSDTEFLRRVYIDLTGVPPTSAEVQAFVADTRDTKVKRDEMVDKLVGSPDYIDYWTNKWADLLQVNRKFLGAEGASAFRNWIRNEIASNTPYDQFAKKILTSSGSNKEHPEASYYKILRDPAETMENTTHLFLAVRFNCNKCHDHPFERWTQDQYYQTAAYFARVGLQADPNGGGAQIGGTAVEGAKPLYEVVVDRPEGEIKHERTGQVTPPKFPFECQFTHSDDASRRQELANWITSANNPYFARSYVNRLWGYLFGVGIMEPIDDIRAGNPPTNPQLLDYLTEEFLKNNFDVRHMVRLICKSRTYQLSVDTNKWNSDDKVNYSHATARRLPAEVLYDSIYRVMGATSRIPGVAPGTRAAALPDSGVELPSGFLSTFGRPVRESACECERTSGLQLGPVMALISGPTVADAIADGGNELTKLVAAQPDDGKLVNEIFLRVLNRPAAEREVNAVKAEMQDLDMDHQKLVAKMNARAEVAAGIRAKLEAERAAAIDVAQKNVTAREQELAPSVAEAEKQRQEKINQTTADLKQYEEGIAARVPEFEQRAKNSEWVVLTPKAATASTGAKMTIESDGSVIAEAKTGATVFTVTAETDLKDVTGIRLEALADDRLPSKGPGNAPNGNFVLTEFEITAVSKANGGNPQKIALENAVADFNQPGYDVKTAIDGQKPNQNNGWAIHGQVGQTHVATFETKMPLGFDGGTTLTFTLDQRYADNMHTLGKFRLSITRAPKPVGVGITAEIAAILNVPADQRNDSQKTALLDFVKKHDPELQKRQKSLEVANQPLPIDPKLKELKDRLEYVSRPVPADSQLTQLQKDVEISQQQLGNKRLTAAQDLAWALINSPEFLFNH